MDLSMLELSDQEIARRTSLNELRSLGINPYPAAEYQVTAYAQEIINSYPEGNEEREALLREQRVRLAGRIMGRRIMGKASFVELADSTGRIQIYITRDSLADGENTDLYNIVFKKCLDIGDFIGVEGYVFKTQTGEVSVHALSLTVLSKSLRPLPIVKEKDGKVFDGFTDPEQRYRRRYVDLLVNDGVRDIFIKRNKIFTSMRNFFNEHG